VIVAIDGPAGAGKSTVLKLLAGKLETVDPGFGVEMVALAAEARGPLSAGFMAALA
jgi:cytidylate kinase